MSPELKDGPKPKGCRLLAFAALGGVLGLFIAATAGIRSLAARRAP